MSQRTRPQPMANGLRWAQWWTACDPASDEPKVPRYVVAGLGTQHVTLLGMLAVHSREGTCEASAATLGRWCNWNDRGHVRRVLADLCRVGAVGLVAQRGKSGHLANRLLLTAPAEALHDHSEVGDSRPPPPDGWVTPDPQGGGLQTPRVGDSRPHLQVFPDVLQAGSRSGSAHALAEVPDDALPAETIDLTDEPDDDGLEAEHIAQAAEDGLTPLGAFLAVAVADVPPRLHPGLNNPLRGHLRRLQRAGWTVEQVRADLAAQRWPEHLTSPGVVVRHLQGLSRQQPPAPTGRATWPTWCGQCDETTRRVLADPTGDPLGVRVRCPRCSPLGAVQPLVAL